MSKPTMVKQSIRTICIDSLKLGGDGAVSFMDCNNTTPVFALEVPYKLESNTSSILKAFWDNDFKARLVNAQKSDCDLICVKFNIDESCFDLDKLQTALEIVTKTIHKPLILKGTHFVELNKKLLPLLANGVKKPSIIAYLEENSYESVIESIVKNGHIAVMRSPIDINIAKELNILAMDNGQPADKILIDTDMGALGYGLDYGYSIMERIKLAGFDGDKMLNMPLIAFVGEEVFKSKETKSEKFEPDWGELEQRAIMWEISTAIAVMSAGANVVVLNHPKTIQVIKQQLENEWN